MHVPAVRQQCVSETDARGVKADPVSIIPPLNDVKIPVAEIVWVANHHRRGRLGQVLLGRLQQLVDLLPVIDS